MTSCASVVVHPVRLEHLVGVDPARAERVGEHDRARQPRHRRLGLHQRAVTGDRGHLDAVARADLGHQQRVLLEREGVEVADLAEQLPAGVDHRLDAAVAEPGGDLHALLEALVGAAAELHVHGDAEAGHGRDATRAGAACRPRSATGRNRTCDPATYRAGATVLEADTCDALAAAAARGEVELSALARAPYPGEPLGDALPGVRTVGSLGRARRPGLGPGLASQRGHRADAALARPARVRDGRGRARAAARAT